MPFVPDTFSFWKLLRKDEFAKVLVRCDEYPSFANAQFPSILDRWRSARSTMRTWCRVRIQ